MGKAVSGLAGGWSSVSTGAGGMVTAGASVPMVGLAISIITSVGAIPVTCLLLVLCLVPVRVKKTPVIICQHFSAYNSCTCSLKKLNYCSST